MVSICLNKYFELVLKQTAQYLNTFEKCYSSFSPNNKSSKSRAWPSVEMRSEICQNVSWPVPDIMNYQTSAFQHHPCIIGWVIKLFKCSKFDTGVPNGYFAFQIGYWYVSYLVKAFYFQHFHIKFSETMYIKILFLQNISLPKLQ